MKLKMTLAVALILNLPFDCIISAHAAVPLRWTVETSRVAPAALDAYHGETLHLEATLKSYGAPIAPGDGEASIYWQTNGMGTAYWSAPATCSNNVLSADFTPPMDPGAAVVHGFIGLPGDIYRASFTLRFRASPGVSPNAIEMPVRILDFATIAVTNAPYYTQTETDGKIDEIRADVATNAADIASNSSQLSQMSQLLDMKADKTIAVATTIPHYHLPADCFPITAGIWGGMHTFTEEDVICEGPDEWNEINLNVWNESEGYWEPIAIFFNWLGKGTYYYCMGGSGVNWDEYTGLSELYFNGRQAHGSNQNAFPVLEPPGTITNHYGVVYSNAFDSTIADLTAANTANAQATTNLVRQVRNDLSVAIDRKADLYRIDYEYGAVTNSAWRCSWGERQTLCAFYGNGIDDGYMRWRNYDDENDIILTYDAEWTEYGDQWQLEVGQDGDAFSGYAIGAGGANATNLVFQNGYTLTRSWLREMTPIATNVVSYITLEIDPEDNRPVLYYMEGD